MPTMNVSLTPELAEFVAETVKSGDYASASEVVRDALRMLRRDFAMEVEKLENLRREIALADEDIAAGRFSEWSASDIAAEILADEER